MAMTKEEFQRWNELQDELGERGYPTYGWLLSLFELRLTSDDDVVGFMEPGKGTITINRDLATHYQLLVIRHEILHEYLNHEQRLMNHLVQKLPALEAIEEGSLRDIATKSILYANKVFNIAGDYEISNRGYTEQDKLDVRNLELHGKVLGGLVTEDKHKDWVDYTIEEMYDLLIDAEDSEGSEGPMPPNSEGGGGQQMDPVIVYGRLVNDKQFINQDGIDVTPRW